MTRLSLFYVDVFCRVEWGRGAALLSFVASACWLTLYSLLLNWDVHLTEAGELVLTQCGSVDGTWTRHFTSLNLV